MTTTEIDVVLVRKAIDPLGIGSVAKLASLDALDRLLEKRNAEIDELQHERDFWRNEYEELLECIGGEDPRRDS